MYIIISDRFGQLSTAVTKAEAEQKVKQHDRPGENVRYLSGNMDEVEDPDISAIVCE